MKNAVSNIVNTRKVLRVSVCQVSVRIRLRIVLSQLAASTARINKRDCHRCKPVNGRHQYLSCARRHTLPSSILCLALVAGGDRLCGTIPAVTCMAEVYENGCAPMERKPKLFMRTPNRRSFTSLQLRFRMSRVDFTACDQERTPSHR